MYSVHRTLHTTTTHTASASAEPRVEQFALERGSVTRQWHKKHYTNAEKNFRFAIYFPLSKHLNFFSVSLSVSVSVKKTEIEIERERERGGRGEGRSA